MKILLSVVLLAVVVNANLLEPVVERHIPNPQTCKLARTAFHNFWSGFIEALF